MEDGIGQAETLGKFWVQGVRNDGIPLPETVYTSPLARCLETTKLVYSEVMAVHARTLQPIVKELLRERLTDHTCDKRSPRSWIAQNYPDYAFEQNFEETDPLWRADHTETNEKHVARKQRLLEDIFETNDDSFISLSTHSYAISAILEVIGAPNFRVSEGAMVPLFVKAVKLVQDT